MAPIAQLVKHLRGSSSPAPAVDQLWTAVLGREPRRDERRRWTAALKSGASRSDLALSLVQSDEYRRSVVASVGERPDLSDEEFLRAAYQELLDREADPSGLASYSERLRGGMPRAQVLDVLAASDEHVNRIVNGLIRLPNLRELRPERYEDVPTVGDEGRVPCFTVEEPADFDWLENAITQFGYYDKPGIWGYSITTDKRLMAELLASFRPMTSLDLGCSNGTIVQCLVDLGVDAEGIEISASAVQRASSTIRRRIHRGDLATVTLPRRYSLVYGLDIFEHLNPNRLTRYLERVADLLEPGGYLFANIPAYGADPVFGTVFEPFLRSWQEDVTGGRMFRHLQVDQDGYPCHGHLIWAPSPWWIAQFEELGLRREPQIESAIHAKYDAYFRLCAPARAALYVFSKQAEEEAVEDIARRFAQTPSVVLADEPALTAG